MQAHAATSQIRFIKDGYIVKHFSVGGGKKRSSAKLVFFVANCTSRASHKPETSQESVDKHHWLFHNIKAQII